MSIKDYIIDSACWVDFLAMYIMEITWPLFNSTFITSYSLRPFIYNDMLIELLYNYLIPAITKVKQNFYDTDLLVK